MTDQARGIAVISDPWEFATLTGIEQVTGTVEALTETTATLRLDSVLQIQGNVMTIAEVSARHTGAVFKIPCTTTPANIIFRSEDHPGWYAAIGTFAVETGLR
jgi:hypothetical protein